ncbi:hypothetical protein TNCV_1799701 [Trichonephila clavipes]|nr:hypothetical protein TNCV_1799701 [Trichonephila clavipes]
MSCLCHLTVARNDEMCRQKPVAMDDGLSCYSSDGVATLLSTGATYESCIKIIETEKKIRMYGLAIHQNDHQARRRFVEWAQNEIDVVPDFQKRILVSDEAHFWLNGYVNKQNCRIWSEANPQVYV